MSTEQPTHDSLGFERLVFFSDAVFAIAITLMALEIRLPEIEPERIAVEMVPALWALIPHVFVYALSFLVIGTYWMLHHRLFRIIKGYDVTLMWLNLLFLMFVAFVPASTNALGTYDNVPTISAIYAVTLALVGLSEFVVWAYAAYRRHYIRQDMSPRLLMYISLRILLPPILFLITIPLANISTTVMQLSWSLMIPAFIVLRLLFPEEHAARRRFEHVET